MGLPADRKVGHKISNVLLKVTNLINLINLNLILIVKL
jgi:hypothetical protein